MSELILTERSNLTAIADAVRNRTGATGEMTLGGIIGGINGISTNPTLQDKTVTPSTSSQTITADSGYDGLDTVTVSAMPTATQATPSISVDSSGLITASATQTAGYVAAGTKSSTHQLAFQPAKTITPSTASQIAVSSGYYTGGNITVAAVPTQTKTVTPKPTSQNVTPDSGKFLSKVTVNGDSNLVAGNIKSGTSIFGVTGTYVGSGGGDTSMEDALVARTSTTYKNDRVTTIGIYAFYRCSQLKSVSFSKCISISDYAFNYCTKLTSVSLPECTTIGQSAFAACHSLASLSLPKCTSIKNYAFQTCYALQTIYLTASTVCTLASSNALSNTGIWSAKGSIFVPASLVDSYKTASHWSFFSNRIFSA